MLRNAVMTDGSDPDPEFTVTFKDIISSLNAIDTVGFRIIGDKLVVEPWE